VYLDPGAGSIVLQIAAATALVFMSSMSRLRQSATRFIRTLLRIKPQ
jgi:hypothetical protein